MVASVPSLQALRAELELERPPGRLPGLRESSVVPWGVLPKSRDSQALKMNPSSWLLLWRRWCCEQSLPHRAPQGAEEPRSPQVRASRLHPCYRPAPHVSPSSPTTAKPIAPSPTGCWSPLFSPSSCASTDRRSCGSEGREKLFGLVSSHLLRLRAHQANTWFRETVLRKYTEPTTGKSLFFPLSYPCARPQPFLKIIKIPWLTIHRNQTAFP